MLVICWRLSHGIMDVNGWKRWEAKIKCIWASLSVIQKYDATLSSTDSRRYPRRLRNRLHDAIPTRCHPPRPPFHLFFDVPKLSPLRFSSYDCIRPHPILPVTFHPFRISYVTKREVTQQLISEEAEYTARVNLPQGSDDDVGHQLPSKGQERTKVKTTIVEQNSEKKQRSEFVESSYWEVMPETQ